MPSPIEVGTVVADTYEVTALLGQGGMGAVWEARHLRLPGKRVAIKVLLAEGVAQGAIDPTFFARFRREAEIASRLGHPNIIEALDFNTLPGGAPYMVLEHLSGETLAARLRRGTLPLEPTLAIVRQIGSALHAAHRANIVHRDLKPDNIFLVPTDSGGVLTERVKILDFGISKIRDSSTMQTQASTLLGTPQYMSPEQASGKHEATDQRTDQFALAAIVYEMLSGEAAFGGATLAEVVCKVMLEQPPPLAHLVPSLPPRVVAAVQRGLAKKADDRFSDIRAFVEELSGRPLATLDGAGATAAISRASGAALQTERTPVSWVPYIVGAVGATIAIIALGFAVSMRPTTLPPAVTVAAAAPAPNSASIPAAVPAPALAPTVTPAVTPAPLVAEARPAPATHSASTQKGKSPVEPLAIEAVADLAGADKALDSGDTTEAIRLARHSLNVQRSERAFSLIARAFCKAGDLGNARAQLAHVGGDKTRVLRECRSSGTPLD